MPHPCAGSPVTGEEARVTFSVKAGATVTVNGYPGYTSYTFGDGTTTTETIADEKFVYTAEADVTITITPVDGNNYFYSIEISYSAEPETPVEPEITEWVLDATADLEALAKGDKADGDTQVAGTNDFFTIHFSANTKIDGSNKNFEDGYSASQRLNFGGKTVIGSTIKNALEFTTNGPVTVTVWWVKNGDSERPVEILNASGASIAQTTDNPASGTLTITTFDITEAGTYYLGGLTNNNYYFKVAVKVAE